MNINTKFRFDTGFYDANHFDGLTFRLNGRRSIAGPNLELKVPITMPDLGSLVDITKGVNSGDQFSATITISKDCWRIWALYPGDSAQKTIGPPFPTRPDAEAQAAKLQWDNPGNHYWIQPA